MLKTSNRLVNHYYSKNCEKEYRNRLEFFTVMGRHADNRKRLLRIPVVSVFLKGNSCPKLQGFSIFCDNVIGNNFLLMCIVHVNVPVIITVHFTYSDS